MSKVEFLGVDSEGLIRQPLAASSGGKLYSTRSFFLLYKPWTAKTSRVGHESQPLQPTPGIAR
jgi:hypothetical protein